MKLHKAMAVTSLLLILLTVNALVYQQEKLLSDGEKILLKLRVVDPRSLMQGDYMALDYELAAQIRMHLVEQHHDEEHGKNNQKGKEDPNEGSKKDQNKNPADVDKNENKSSDSPEQQKIASNSNPDLSPEDRSKQQKLEQWLRKIPDDPGRLLRNKMKREYQRRDKKQIESKQYW